MTQEDKELILKDLCSRLPYGVKVGTTDNDGSLENIWDVLWYNTFTQDVKVVNSIEDAEKLIDFSETKPYLFPLSSMTEEQRDDYYATVRQAIYECLSEHRANKELYDGERPITLKDTKVDILSCEWMLKNHFDYRGLIPRGLAIDCTGLNVYGKDPE